MPKSNPAPFELGIVMAGAISAGAYTAGVVDFLLEALDEWERSKQSGDESVPQHSVVIKALSGASAGGMTAAILAALYNRDCPRVANPTTEEKSQNPLFQSWVNDIDISELLQTNDTLEQATGSILDSTIIDKISKTAFNPTTSETKRPYFDQNLTVFQSVTNLRGVPYLVGFKSDGNLPQGHDLSRHQNATKFVFNKLENDATSLDPADSRDHPSWRSLADAAVASGAFPIGLRSRRLVQPRQQVEETSWWMPLTPPIQDAEGKWTYDRKVIIKPNWPAPVDSWLTQHDYGYWAIDGGTVDNEPLEVVRRELAGDGGRNPRAPDKVVGTTLLIDPFVGWSREAFVDSFKDHQDPAKTNPIWSVFMSMFGALKNQARFKPEELALAQDPNVYSRYMIAPIRQVKGATEKETQTVLSPEAIACGCLGGFGGFLSRKYRVHDYVLGRRNCQQFLRRHFALEITPTAINERFGNITFDQAVAKGWAFSEPAPDPTQPGGAVTKWYLPMIPLVGSARKEVTTEAWPKFYGEAEIAALDGQLAKRLDHVVTGITQSKDAGLGAVWGWVLRRVWRGIPFVYDGLDKKAINAAHKYVLKSLEAHNLWGGRASDSLPVV